ncbi:class I SAM-dependent methyltransferase [Oryzobacter telluris]|uniref:class I SAM-dependent methyltransferase n=1 Tax=Oryzobacter telluris TaxID=3149179 RepID=UPI00370D607C
MADDVNDADSLSPRGTTRCRGCVSTALVSVLDLGRQPLANEMALTADSPDPSFPLHLRICTSCGLGQVGEYVLPERIFSKDYPYISSVSTSWVEHAGAYASDMRESLSLSQDDLVVEVASNDGYLLAQVKELGIPVLGVEPAGNVAQLARGRGVPTLSEFFGLDCARRIIDEYGHPRLVVANNVMAHVPDLHDFAAGLAALCDDETIITVENPSFLNLLRETQFDTIYHEHFSYLTAHAVQRAVGPHGLRLVRVDALPTHGGSNRYWLARTTSAHPVHPSVDETVGGELAEGLLDAETWAAFAQRSHLALDGLRGWLDEQQRQGRTVVGYGAAAKGNTLLNAAGGGPADLLVVVDGSSAKQGRFLPGSHVAVVAPSSLPAYQPDAVLVLPWNIASEVVPVVRDLVPDAECWTAIPTMRRLT